MIILDDASPVEICQHFHIKLPKTIATIKKYAARQLKQIHSRYALCIYNIEFIPESTPLDQGYRGYRAVLQAALECNDSATKLNQYYQNVYIKSLLLSENQQTITIEFYINKSIGKELYYLTYAQRCLEFSFVIDNIEIRAILPKLQKKLTNLVDEKNVVSVSKKLLKNKPFNFIDAARYFYKTEDIMVLAFIEAYVLEQKYRDEDDHSIVSVKTVPPFTEVLKLPGRFPACVKHLYWHREGENDYYSWLVFGKLKNDIYFHLIAACDYTGFDCQGFINIYLAKNMNDIVRYAINDQVRHEILGSKKIMDWSKNIDFSYL